ncbi:MAG: FliM/FliN family flagellar motor switch protein, partial [Verrucomicrobiia bacterium]
NANVDVYVNQKLVARGEVVVAEDNFGIRIKEIVAKSSRP